MIFRLTTVHEKAWIPAFAGMTTGGHPRESGGPLVVASATFTAAKNLALSAPDKLREESRSEHLQRIARFLTLRPKTPFGRRVVACGSSEQQARRFSRSLLESRMGPPWLRLEIRKYNKTLLML